MKYPLRVVRRDGMVDPLWIVDAEHRVVCIVKESEWETEFADMIVRTANRWNRLRPWFRHRTRADWLWQRNR